MRPAQHTVRLPIPLDKAVRALAEREGTSVYALIQRCVKVGAATLAGPAMTAELTPNGLPQNRRGSRRPDFGRDDFAR